MLQLTTRALVIAASFALAAPALAQQNNRPDNDRPGPNMQSEPGKVPDRKAPEYGPTPEGAAQARDRSNQDRMPTSTVPGQR